MARQRGHAGRGPARTLETRRSIAVEAARLMSESGLRDFRMAKLKAAERFGVVDEGTLPSNREIDEALREHQRLFHGDDHVRTLRRLREAAVAAMRFFATHEPRLVGSVLEGTADRHSAVCLHLYSDHPLAVVADLQEHGIAYDEQGRTLRLDRDTTREFPAFVFSADGTPIDLTVLPYDRLRQAPIDRISEKPMQRATLTMLEHLLAGDAAAGVD